MIYSDDEANDGHGARRYRFGDLTLDVKQHTLVRSGVPVSIEPKVFDLLLLLLKNAGDLVSHDQMIAEVWQGRIVSDSAVSACVSAVRRAVGDDGQTQAIIRTVARRGFTFCAPVDVDHSSLSRPPSALPPTIQFTQNHEQKSLAYALAGSGPPLLFTTFGGTSIEADWSSPFFRPLFDAICAQNTLLRFDQIGSGHSDRDMGSVSVAAIANDMLRAADAAGFDQFAVFSQSGSAMSAVHLAAHHPDRVKAMVLNGGYAEGRDLRPETSGTQEMFGVISEAWDKPDSSFLLAYSLLYFPEGPLDLAKDVVEIMNASCPAENMLKMRAELNAESVLEFLPRVLCPTLVVHARKDSIHPLEQARKLAAGIQKSEFLVLDTANHVPMPNSPVWEAFLKTTIEFLNA
ncbi:MAG: alpha/beta fold hydrolase [Pseudomonadota bacterium]